MICRALSSSLSASTKSNDAMCNKLSEVVSMLVKQNATQRATKDPSFCSPHALRDLSRRVKEWCFSKDFYPSAGERENLAIQHVLRYLPEDAQPTDSRAFIETYGMDPWILLNKKVRHSTSSKMKCYQLAVLTIASTNVGNNTL